MNSQKFLLKTKQNLGVKTSIDSLPHNERTNERKKKSKSLFFLHAAKHFMGKQCYQQQGVYSTESYRRRNVIRNLYFNCGKMFNWTYGCAYNIGAGKGKKNVFAHNDNPIHINEDHRDKSEQRGKKRIGKNVKRRQWKKISRKKNIFQTTKERKMHEIFNKLWMCVRLVNEKC